VKSPIGTRRRNCLALFGAPAAVMKIRSGVGVEEGVRVGVAVGVRVGGTVEVAVQVLVGGTGV
jgi:hypothetical protein